MLTEQERAKLHYDKWQKEGWDCRKAYKIICPVCGETAYTFRSYQKYCSYDCKIKASGKRSNARKKRPLTATKCAVCGETFTARDKALYCSNACRQRAYRMREALQIHNTPNAGDMI